ncbi:DUF6624 domain-containing protein [uncultured Kordia sp.]|uniref:DUF6624 domain-containing protein n=1 Tax=uncultured Kordia sp. TaxID=507699 RepID=UPI00261E8725|nr:DUF6624 domain-containing protein [uncultured Kordia sp.]
MKYVTLYFLLFFSFCLSQEVSNEVIAYKDIKAELDTIWGMEQTPIRQRDAARRKHGIDSEQFQKYQKIYKKNHAINEKKVKEILDTYGWPTQETRGERGNWTLCNVLQHSDNTVRIHYLPMMKQAVKDGRLEARFLVRAEDRIATEKGELQLYGGQMKYYPETKSFNVWPVYDPANIDKRRAALGLEPIAPFLKRRFDFDWNLEEQLKRTAEFEQEKNKN